MDAVITIGFILFLVLMVWSMFGTSSWDFVCWLDRKAWRVSEFLGWLLEVTLLRRERRIAEWNEEELAAWRDEHSDSPSRSYDVPVED